MPPSPSKLILLIDDDPSVRRSLGRLLRAHGYDVLDAENMPQALEILARTRPALIVVDMVMPGNSTLDAIRQLQADPSIATLPFVALTASPPRAPQDRALFAEVIAKPTDARILLDMIETILRNTAVGSSTA